ncbi:hypothetical protein M6G65_15705 [Methylobacterium tardum]|uniref:hypothetical protein n=1 Tax=Methylobacterium tardum TaxID=374432 RepID=UPI00201FB694|nr:hypothetical protein [Methylobacterium tardum]URD39702.1 hypothetical protein M6G65_15705 [Methylobacterium tardum]
MPHLTFLRDDLNEAETGDVAADERRPATETLAAFALEAALSPAQRRRIAADPAFALVVQVPAADWVEPVREACGRRRRGVTWRRAPALREARTVRTAETTGWRTGSPAATGCSASRNRPRATCLRPSSPRRTCTCGSRARPTP